MRTGLRRAGTERWRGGAVGSQEDVLYPRSPDVLTPQPAEQAAAKPPEAGGTAGRGPERNPGSRRAPCRGFGEVRAESTARQNKRRAFRIPRRGTPESVPGAEGGVAEVGGAAGTQEKVRLRVRVGGRDWPQPTRGRATAAQAPAQSPGMGPFGRTRPKEPGPGFWASLCGRSPAAGRIDYKRGEKLRREAPS